MRDFDAGIDHGHLDALARAVSADLGPGVGHFVHQDDAIHHPVKLTHRHDAFHAGQRAQLDQGILIRDLDEDRVGHGVHRTKHPRVAPLKLRAHQLLLAAQASAV
jgi:hypothetical protein